MEMFAALFFLTVIFLVVSTQRGKNKWVEPSKPFPPEWRTILTKKVAFYNSLSPEEKQQFEFKIQEFLLNYRITGIQVDIDLTDKLLVASSAIIPIFQFPDWRYTNLSEVLLYPNKFSEEFETAGPDRKVLGMVGDGHLEGIMILSKPALHLGFDNNSDKKNTAIHEFIHLIDKADGSIDGIPALLLEQPYIVPWLDLMKREISEIHDQSSDINPYGGKSNIEFFAVASEYFFERPRLLKKKHPELYQLLEEVFDQKMLSRRLKKKKWRIRRNSPCPCNSNQKFKNCCGKKHYA